MPQPFLAAIFDLDGVLTDTADVHARAWKDMVDPIVSRPFDVVHDYQAYVAGRPRIAGIRDFLKSRDVVLPEDELHKIGEEKNRRYVANLARVGVRVNPEMLARMEQYTASGVKIGIASSSKNARLVLDMAKLPFTGILVDGNDVESLGLAPKPSPDIFIHTAKLLGVPMAQCIIFEDSEAALQQIAPAHGVLVHF